jgi:hypothetical protein
MCPFRAVTDQFKGGTSAAVQENPYRAQQSSEILYRGKAGDYTYADWIARGSQ